MSRCGERSGPGKWRVDSSRYAVPISVIFENLEYGSSIEEIIENYSVTREQIQAVLDFAAKSAGPPPVSPDPAHRTDAHTL